MKIIITIIVFFELSFAQLTGVVSGRIIDKNTQIPLVGANVQVIDTDLGTASDINGIFYLNKIPSGTKHLSITMIGYEKRIFLNLPITSVRPINLSVELAITPVEMDEVEVSGKIFSKSSESIISSTNINQLEFRSDPGSAWDVQRAVQSLPSVNQISDHLNEIIVRGGNHGENLFMMDNIEIENPNHFGVEGYGGGGFSMINPLFIKNIEFTPGAFSARYGDVVGGVMDVSLREGSRSNLELDIDISMGGAGLVTEGPINKGRGSFIFGSIWSYLDKILTNIGLTTTPYFNNHQIKFVYDINSRYQLTLNGLIASNKAETSATKFDYLSLSYYGIPAFDHNSEFMIGGVTLKSLFGKYGYSLTTLSYSHKTNQQSTFDFGLNNYPWFRRNNTLNDLTFKNDWFLQTPIGEFKTGISINRMGIDQNEWLNADIRFKYDTTYWFDNKWHLPDSLTKPEEISPLYYRPTIRFNILTNYKKYAYYLQNNLKINKNLQLVSGIRFDYFTGTNSTVFSSRLNLRYTVNQANAFHIAYGRHYQFPEYFIVLKDSLNSNLKTKYADQYVLGFEHFLKSDFRVTLELYYKYFNDIYTHYYWSHEPETYPEQLNHLLHWENEGSRRNFGLELLLHKKLSQNWHGNVSYAWNNSLAKNDRTIKQVPEPNTYLNDGKWYHWDLEVRHNLKVIGGWKKKFNQHSWYQQLKTNSLFKTLSLFIPIADEVELSFRYSYSSGRPFTEKTYYPELYDWKYANDANWNGSRYPDYKRLDLMFLKRHNFNKMNIVIYINFINVFNRDNIFSWVYISNGTKETSQHFKTLPIGGITIEL